MGQVISNLDVCDQKQKEESSINLNESSQKEYLLQASVSSEIQHLQNCFQIYKKDGERSSDMPKISSEVIINNITQQAIAEYFQIQNQSQPNLKSNSQTYDALEDLNSILSQKLSLRNSQRNEEILQIYDHLEYRMRASPLNVSTFLQEKNLTENTENLQGSSIESMIAQKRLNAQNEGLKIGFKTPESHIEMLKTFQSSSNVSGGNNAVSAKNKSFIEQYFHISDQTQLESSNFRSIVSKQIFILYCIYLQRQKLNEEDKKDFFDYISQFLSIPKDIEKSQNENEKKEVKVPFDTLPKLSFQDAKSQIMIETGLKFSLSLLKEIGKLDKKSLQNSLAQLLESLKDQRPGCLYSTTEKAAFQLDENLNQARELLTDIINQNILSYDPNVSQQLIENSLKIIFTLGILRSNIEDFLQVLATLHEINTSHRKLGIQINLGEEIQMIYNFYGFDQSQNIQKQNKFSQSEIIENQNLNAEKKNYKLGQMNLLTTTSIKMNLNSGDLSYIKGSLGDKLIADDEYFYVYKSSQEKGMQRGIYKFTQACQMQNSQGAAFRMAGKNLVLNTSQILQDRSSNGLDSHMFIVGKYIFMKHEVPLVKSQNQSDSQKLKTPLKKEDENKIIISDDLVQSKLMIIDSQSLEPLQKIVQLQQFEQTEQKKDNQQKQKAESKKLLDLEPITVQLDHVPSWKNQQTYRNQDICFDNMPMITDGKNLYIFGRSKLKKKDGESQKYQIVINIYKIDISEDIPKFIYERQITLLWKNNEAFERDENSGTFMGQISQWSTNGEVIVCFSKTNKYIWFDVQTGMLISEQNASCEHNDHTLIYYNYNQSYFIRMQTRDHGTDCHRYWIFNFQNFKVQKQQVVKKNQLQLIRQKLFSFNNPSKEYSYQKQNIIKNLMKKQKQNIFKIEDKASENNLEIDAQYCLILDFINKFIKSKFQIFYEEMKNKAHTTNRVEDILKLFKFQNCTYLTENFFILLADNLFSMKSLICNPQDQNEKKYKNLSEDEQSIANQYSLLYILNLVNANFKALSHCQIKLSYLLDNESENNSVENKICKGYKYFMSAFEEIIVSIVENGAHKQSISEIQDSEIKEELTQLWRQIEDISKEIIDESVSLLHQDPSSMVEILLTTLSKSRSEISLQNVCVQISYLNLKDNLRKVIEHPKIQDLTVKIFEFYSNFINKQYEEVVNENLDQENENLAESTMRDYILNYSQLILQKYCETQENLIKYHKKLLQKQVQQQIEKHQDHKHFKMQSNDVMVTVETLQKDKWVAEEAELNDGFINLNKYEKPLIFMIDLTFTYLQNHLQTIYQLLDTFSQQVLDSDKMSLFESQKMIAEKQLKQVSISNKYSNILKNRNVFYEISFIYTQTLTLLKLDSFENHNSLAMVNFIDKFMETINLCSKFQSLDVVSSQGNSEKNKKQLKQVISFQKRCPELFMTVDAIFRQLIWLLCQTASKMINITQSEKEEVKQQDDKSKAIPNKSDNEKISDHYKKNLLNIKESSLLAGGIETRYLTQVISQERQKILRTYLLIIEDKYLQEQLNIEKEESRDFSTDDDRILKAIIGEGIDEPTDCLIKCIQKSFESKIPIVQARLAGQNGLKMTRVAFSLLIKFGDLLEDFVSLVDQVNYFNQFENTNESDPKSNIDINQLLNILKELPQFTQIRNKWEEASKMRKWIQDKKSKLQLKYEKEVRDQVLKKKKEQDINQSQQAQANLLKEQEDQNQIDSTALRSNLDKKNSKKEQKKMHLTSEEEISIQDEAFNKVEKELESIFDQIKLKAEFLIKLQIPLQFLNKKNLFNQFEIPKELEQEDDTHNKKEENENEINHKDADSQSVGTNVLSLLQAPVQYGKIQEQVEKTYVNAFKRVTGLKIISDLVKLEAPQFITKDIINWFCTSLRSNKNIITHYMDKISGQGTYLENKTRMYFFQVLNQILKKLKESETVEDVKFYLNNGLLWRYMGRDHKNLYELNIFQALHKGNGTKNNIIKKCWGKYLQPGNFDQQSLPSDILGFFENLLLSIIARIVDSSDLKELELSQQLQADSQKKKNNLLTLQKAKSVINEDLSESLFAQGYDIIFKELNRYVKIMNKLFKGIDWTTYVKSRQAKEEKNNAVNQKILQVNLLDEELEESGDDLKSDDDEKIDLNDIVIVNQENAEDAENQKKKSEENEKKQLEERRKLRTELQLAQIDQIYQEQFLKKLLGIVEIFTNIQQQLVSQKKDDSQSNGQINYHRFQRLLKKLCSSSHIQILLQILVLASPNTKFIVLRILSQLVQTQIVTSQVFDQAVSNILNNEPNQSEVAKIYNIFIQSSLIPKHLKSPFIQFLFAYLHQIRSKMWIKKQMEGEGVYSVSCEIVRILRLIFESSFNFNQVWRSDLQNLIDSMFSNYLRFSQEYQIDLEIISSLIRGCEYLGMIPYQVGFINSQQNDSKPEQEQNDNEKEQVGSKLSKKQVRIVGFVHKKWLQRTMDWSQNELRVYQTMKDSNQKVLVVEYQNEDLSDTKFQVYSPQYITLLNDFNQIKEQNPNQALVEQKDNQIIQQNQNKKEYEITSQILDVLFKESNILEDQNINQNKQDIHQLQQKATAMKLIHFNLENDPQIFMQTLKKSKYYDELLRFVCQQQNNQSEQDTLDESENKKITLIDWLEQKCAAIRLQACERQACLIQQKEVRIQLVKDKLYVLTQPDASVEDKNEFNMISIQLISAINYQAFEEKKEFKLLLESNIQVDEQNAPKSPVLQIDQDQKKDKLMNENEEEIEQTDDIILVRPENLQNENGLGFEILNQCKSIITFDIDFDELVGIMVKKQKCNKEKYSTLTSKTVFIVDEEDFNQIQDILNDKQFTNNQSQKESDNINSLYQKTLGSTPFEESLIHEIMKYGGFSRVVAEKIIKEGSLESKTLHFSKIVKQIKDGVINVKELEEQREAEIQSYLKNQENSQNSEGIKKLNKRQFQRKKQKIEQKYFERSEEKSEMLNGFRRNFLNFLNNSDSNENIEQLNNRHVYFQKVNSFYTTDNFEDNLHLEYEQILKRLFQTYCRQIFWNLIQNDDIQTIFPKILLQSIKINENQIEEIQEQESNKQQLLNSMRSFSNFIKIIGNECFITNDKKYIANFKGFLKKVVQTCSQDTSGENKYKELLRIFLEECIIECYQDHFSEMTGDDNNEFQKRIFEYFQSETKAQQLINPIVMIEIIQLVVEYKSTLIFENLINLLSVLASVGMYFRGNQDLKTRFIEQIIRIIDLVQKEFTKGKDSSINLKTIEQLVNLKIFDNYFQEIENPFQYDKEESKYAKTVLKDDSSKELNGFSRKNYERQVYLYRNQVHQRFIEFDQHRFDSSKIVIELAFKLKQLSEIAGIEVYFCFQNNLISYLDLYKRIISLLETNDIKHSSINKYLTFYNSLDDQKKIYSHDIELRNPEEGCDIQTLEVDFSGEDGQQIVEKVLTRIDGDSQFNSQGAAVFVTQDIDGQNPIVMFNKTLFGKDQTLTNVYSKGKKFYVHYPVFPNFTYTISINEEEPKFALLEKQLYEQFDDFCHIDQGVFYLGGNRQTLHILVDDKILKPYKNHLDTKRVNFGKRSIIMLLQSGHVYGFGQNKFRHFADQEAQKNFEIEQQMPFHDTKDKIESIETYKRITIAVTKNGHVYAIGDKLKKILKIKDERFGFYKLPVSQKDLEKNQDGPKEQENAENAQKQILDIQQEDTQREVNDQQTLKAKNIWISKCKQQNNYVIYCLFENTVTNNLEIHSIGKNIGGSLLGLGENIQEAFHFQKINFIDPSDLSGKQEVQIKSVEGVDIRCGLNHTIIGINNCEYVFVLGCYNKGQQAQEEIIFVPKILSICQQYKIQKFDTEKNKTVIVAQKKDSEKIQVLVGQFAPLNKEDTFKTAQFDLDLSSKNSPNKIQQIYLRDQQAYLSFTGNFQYDPYNTGRAFAKKGFQANNLKQSFQYMTQPKQIGEKVKGSGLIMKLTPDYGFFENKDFIKHNQNDWDKFEKQMNEYKDLMKDEPNGIKEFDKQLDDFVQKWLKDSNFLEMMTYWKNIKEKSDIDSSRGLVLKEHEKFNEQISFECKKFNIGLSSTYCSYIWGSLTYISKSINSKVLQNCLPLLSVFMEKKQLIPWSVINKMLKQHLNTLETDSENIAIHVNRKKSHEFAVSGQIDLKGEHTIYSQVQKKLEASKYRGMRINSSDKRAWFAKFIGEYAVDDGGLFRECLSEMCSELRSNVLPILIQTKNQQNNVGLDREMWVLNPGSTSDQQLKMIEFLGALMGMSFRSGILLDLYISKFTWKQIVGDEITKDDLRMIDELFVKDLDRILESSKSLSEDEFKSEYGETHTMSILLSNNQVVDLVENGRNIPLQKDQAELYYEKALEARLDESKLQVQSLVDGIDKTFDKKFLRIINWKYLEYKVVGSNEISVERLKEITSYRNCSETHDVIKRFWQVLDNFSNEDKISYLRFVWGRTRLPLKEEEVLENHTIQLDENASSARLPVGRTCFFRLELPPYESSLILKTKLLYSIHHCRNIDADYDRATVPNEEEAPNNNENQNVAAAVNPENEESEESEEQSRLHHNPGADEYSSDNTQELHEEEEEEEME